MLGQHDIASQPTSRLANLFEIRVADWIRNIAALVFLVAIATVVAVDVVARYFFNAPLNWAQDITSMALLLTFTAAIVVATADSSHVMAEMVHERLPWRLRRLIDGVGALSGAAVMGVCGCWQAYETVGMYTRGEGPDTIDLPYWPVSLAVSAFALLTTIILVLRAGRNAADVIRGELKP